MTTRNEAIEVARKLRALAESAKDAEKANATQKLKSFCDKHGLNEEEYSTESIRVSIAYKNKEERALLSNVLCMVMESNNVKGDDKNNSFSFRCTPYQFELIKDAFSYYRKMYTELCEAVLVAMVTKNEIVNKTKPDKPFEMEPMTPEERKQFENQFTNEPPPPEKPDGDTASKQSEVPPSEPQSPPPSQQEVVQKQDWINRFLFILESKKWSAPKPKAKLFLS